ncbi:cuticle protein, putative [Pediculus humanus corporis]|uniref:Cuticle protein, putative n=1 Tax=Pediculus humanus subsp. corporis TaxID=121224 RepID=E0VUZ7_PEDHC|nr:cuticle protein, putative [Pediculus humanus corporis]EEB17203.1 cuticle protein, putative [Pediculus humanus corporis]
MKFLVVLLAVFAVVATRPSNPSFHEPILQLYQSLGNQGQYAYGYTGSSSTKSESRSANGLTQGSYSYVDGDGVLQKVNYQADNNGFHVSATNLPVGPSGETAGTGAVPSASFRGTARYGSAGVYGARSGAGYGEVSGSGLLSGAAGGGLGSGSYSFSAPAVSSIGSGVSGLSSGFGAGHGAFGSGVTAYNTNVGGGVGAGLGVGQGSVLGTAYTSGVGLGGVNGAGLGDSVAVSALGGGAGLNSGSYSFSAPAVSSVGSGVAGLGAGHSTYNSGPGVVAVVGNGAGFQGSSRTGFGVGGSSLTALYGAPASPAVVVPPAPVQDTPEVSAEKARHYAAFEAAKYNAAVSVDDSAHHDDGQYRPNPSEDDGSYRGEGNALGFGVGLGSLTGFDDGQYRPNPNEDDGSYRGEGAETGLGVGFGAGTGLGVGQGLGVTANFRGLSFGTVSGHGANAGASSGGHGFGASAGINSNGQGLGASASFGPFTASAGLGSLGGGKFGVGAGTNVGSGGFGASASAGRFGVFAGHGTKTPASTEVAGGYGAGVRAGTGYSARYGTGYGRRAFYTIPSTFPSFSQYFTTGNLGQYTYGYSSGDQSSHQETRSADGSTHGGYSYVDTDGVLQTVKYVSDATGGFRVKATNLPVAVVAH